MKPIHNVASTLIPQSRMRWIVGSTHSILWMLYWQSCCNVEITTSNSRRLHKVNTTASTLHKVDTTTMWQRRITLDSKFTS